MWLGCLLALWATAMVLFVFLLAMGLFIEYPWLLLIPTLAFAWRWRRAVHAERRTP